MIIDKIREYFMKCPVLDELRKINVDYLGPDELAYTIDPTPSDTILKRYTDGAKIKQYLFVVASREFYGDDVIQSIENSGFYERLAGWLEEESYKDNLPELTGNKRSQSIEVLTSGYLFGVNEDRGHYQIQLRLTYYEGR